MREEVYQCLLRNLNKLEKFSDIKFTGKNFSDPFKGMVSRCGVLPTSRIVRTCSLPVRYPLKILSIENVY